MGAGGPPPGAEERRSGRDQERKERRVHAETEHVAAVEGPKTRKGQSTGPAENAETQDVAAAEMPKTKRKDHSTGPAERSGRSGPTGRDSSVVDG